MGGDDDIEEEQTERWRLATRQGLRNVVSFGVKLSFMVHGGAES